MVLEPLSARWLSPQCLQNWAKKHGVKFLIWFLCERTQFGLDALWTLVIIEEWASECEAAIFAHGINNRSDTNDLCNYLLYLVV
jgi:hypothetical protein